jgi:hypothetical protein
MTRREARRKNLPPGFAIRLDTYDGEIIYLADYRGARFLTTTYPGDAEYFGRIIDADEMARRVSFVTGQPWIVTTVPADNLDEAWRLAEAPCTDVPSRPTPTSEDIFREAWEAFRLECREGGAFDRMLANILDMVESELDDEDAEVIAASTSLPGTRSRIVAPDVP